jgi:hypothetical protein
MIFLCESQINGELMPILKNFNLCMKNTFIKIKGKPDLNIKNLVY